MASGIIDYNTYNLKPEKPAGSLVLPAFPSFSSMFCAILDELMLALNAEAVALVKYQPVRSQITIDIGRGDWANWSGSRLPWGQEMLEMVTTLGKVNIHQPHFLLPMLKFSRPQSEIQAIYHSPLIYAGHSLGAIWVGRQSVLPLENSLMFNSVTEMMSNTLHTTRQERFKDCARDAAILSLIRRLAAWDLPTFNHSVRMVPWAKRTAIGLGRPDQEVRVICWATLLHDIGKMYVPHSILRKPGCLNSEEWALIKLHPGLGSKMISSIKRLSVTGKLIESHHEKYDGTGYPFGLKGEEIPIGARILALSDAYGSMTEQRDYKKTYNHQEAVEEIKRCTGTHFDPLVAQAFLSQFN
jgi:HD-GYP domain-containing protein (c-di-GMP phosphodiesterase class II)